MSGNPLKSIMGAMQPQASNPMAMFMQIMSSGNPQQTAMQMLAQKNPQAYQMIQSGASPQQLMQQFGITPQQIEQIQSQFTKR